MLAIDLCAGSGWAVACQQLRISELGIEIMPEAIATRDAMGVLTQNVSISDLPDDFCAQAPLQIAGPPCQTFSAAGNGEGRRALDEVLNRIQGFSATGNLLRGGSGDPRTWLVLEPLRLAVGGMPTYIVWEQVPAVLPVWEACADTLRTSGYSVWTGLLHSEQYGVPQTRKRAFLIARRDGEPASPPPVTHSRYYSHNPERLDAGVLPWVSMAQALGWSGAVMRSNYGTGGDPAARGLRSTDQPAPTITSKIDRNKWAYCSSTMPGATIRTENQPAPTVAFGNDAASIRWVYRNGNQANSAERTLNTPAPTVHFGARSNRVTWQPSDVRVTVAEAAILQTFPSDHPFQGVQGKRYLQVGNAVPPLLAWHILRNLTGAL